MGNLKGSIQQQTLDTSLATKNVSVQVSGKSYLFTDHSKLKNLDYASSGHTGFAGIEFGTTAEWRARQDYCPISGMIIVYTDYRRTVDEHGKSVLIPAIKIGNGTDLLRNLAFVDEDVRIDLVNHINDEISHITQAEREFWNDKLNYVEPENTELLQFTRN